MSAKLAAEICNRVLKKVFCDRASATLRRSIIKNQDDVIFWPEDFVVFFTVVALEVGIDLKTYGAKLSPGATRPEWVPGVAFRRVAEVAGAYVEHPGALTLFPVSRVFLIAMTAVIIGIATGRAVDLDPTLGGAAKDAASVLIAILCQRYLESTDEPKTDWLEEAILAVLERHGPQSVKGLHCLTNIHMRLLSTTLRRLLSKKLVVRDYKWGGKREAIYGLPQPPACVRPPV